MDPFVIASYGLSVAMLAGLTIFILARDRTLRIEMERRREPP